MASQEEVMMTYLEASCTPLDESSDLGNGNDNDGSPTPSPPPVASSSSTATTTILSNTSGDVVDTDAQAVMVIPSKTTPSSGTLSSGGLTTASAEMFLEGGGFDAEQQADVVIPGKRSCCCGAKLYSGTITATRIVIFVFVVVISLGALAFGISRFAGSNNNKHISQRDGDTSNSSGGGSSDNPATGWDDVQRQTYYELLVDTLLAQNPFVELGSPVARALEWLAFRDIPLQAFVDGIIMLDGSRGGDDAIVPRSGDEMLLTVSDLDKERLTQRFVLLVWYFALGGPELWREINQDPSSGWVEHGSGLHECNWKGIDCTLTALSSTSATNSNSNAGELMVTGLRLPGGVGITLTGTSLPTELGLLTRLENLDISTNRLRGSLPEEWKALTDLVILNIGDNYMDSVIPSWISDLRHLSAINLSYNSFSGTLPSEILTLANLEHLEIQGNLDLHGNLVDLLESFSNLLYIDISSTQFTGSLPAITSLTNLQVLRAFGTSLDGSIPTEVGSWTALNELAIGESPLTGTLPTELGLLTNLEGLQISRVSNTMEGTLPTELGLLGDSLVRLWLEYSNRHGTLPTEYSRLTKLVALNLSDNPNITGTLPSEYGAMTSLKFVAVMGTALGGTVGPEFCSLDFRIFEADCQELNNFSGAANIECECCTHCYLNL